MDRTLVIQLERVGDLLQTTPFLREIQSANPQVPIDLLVLEGNERALEGLRGLGKIITIPERRILKLNQDVAQSYPKKLVPKSAQTQLLELQLPRYQRVFNFTHEEFGCWMNHHAQAKEKEGGVITPDGEWLFRGDWHVYLVAMPDFRHTNRFNLVDLYRGSGPKTTIPQKGDRFSIARDQDWNPTLPLKGLKIALNPGASELRKRWPAQHFVHLIRLCQQQGYSPILVGAKSDEALCQQMAQACTQPILNFAGKTTLAQMAQLLSKVDCLISNDTGAVHIAAAVGTPVIGMSGVNVLFQETGPWGEGHLIFQAPLGEDTTVLERISPEIVFDAIQMGQGHVSEQELARRVSTLPQVELWRSEFLPASEGPLGGVIYRPLYTGKSQFELRWSDLLRYVFSSVLGSKDEHQRIGIPARPREAFPEREAVHTELVQIRADLNALIFLASQLNEAFRVQSSIGKIRELSGSLDRGIQLLSQKVERQSPFWPILAFQHWQMKMVPILQPQGVFQRYLEILAQTGKLLERLEQELV